jgi:hypothetical protein
MWKEWYYFVGVALDGGSNQQSAMADIVEEDESEKVEIILKTIGPAPTSRLLVPSFIKVKLFPNSTHFIFQFLVRVSSSYSLLKSYIMNASPNFDFLVHTAYSLYLIHKLYFFFDSKLTVLLGFGRRI